MKVKVIKANIDLVRLPQAKVFRDSQGKEWIAIPSVNEKEWQENNAKGQEVTRNPCRVWAGVNRKTGEEKRLISVDIVPYAGDHDDWGHTHLIKFYKGKISDQPKECNIILGNCKESEMEWKNFTNNSSEGSGNYQPKKYEQKAPQQSNNNSGDDGSLPF